MMHKIHYVVNKGFHYSSLEDSPMARISPSSGELQVVVVVVVSLLTYITYKGWSSVYKQTIKQTFNITDQFS